MTAWTNLSDRQRIIAAARESIDHPRYGTDEEGPTMASVAYTLGLLTAAQLIEHKPSPPPYLPGLIAKKETSS